MLIKFDSKVGALTMFAEPALTLIRMMGHSGTVPSALLADDIPAALAKLRQALDGYVEPPPQARSEDDEEVKNWVPLRKRAFPLIQLLEEAARKDASVMWDRARSLTGR
ncbi:MAG TPA: DUF1840 domain-containing protein [Burkholderiales bacterium]